MRVYRDRPFRVPIGRRGVNLTDYLTSPPEEMDLEEDETEYEGMLEADTAASSYIEGARVNSDLYDAYGTHSWSHSMSSSILRRSHPNYSAALVVRPDSPDGGSTPDTVLPPIETRRNTWGLPSSTLINNSNSTLTRQPSIRRPTRSRTVDFNDFSARRRSAYRSTADAEDPRSPEEFAGTLGPWTSTGPTSDEPLGSNGARRFFPFSRRRHDIPPSVMPWSDIGGNTNRPVSPPETASYRPWRSGSGPPVLISGSSLFAEHDEEPELSVPRLRRGGLRAPESMLSRHASPTTGETDGTTPSIVISIQRETHRDAAPTEEVAVPPEEPSRTQVDDL